MTGETSGAGAGSKPAGFVPPVYPFDNLTELAEAASRHPGGMVDLSIGTPCDPPPAKVVEALGSSGAERGYPPAAGSPELREAAAAWIERRFGLRVDPARELAACIGTKEFVAGTPHFLRLRWPERDTVLHPALAYPTYEMGARLAGCRAVAVPLRADGTMDLAAVSPEDAERALCVWVNSPGNPAGQLEDLGEVAKWGRAHGVAVLSDECYVEFTWGDGRGRSILEHGLEGVVALHSLSKRSNLAGVRAGVYAGDPELVAYLAAVRRHAGFMVPGPVQHAAAVAFDDDESVAAQRREYADRLGYLASTLTSAGIPVEPPLGGFYLWVPAPDALRTGSGSPSPGYALARLLAESAGVLSSPGEAYGPAGACHTRLAVVQPLDRLRLVAERLGVG
ncbi:MAG TPA: aminotransferase class I/II-fold pyridoxal phosphate-dependent enzyme [Acidimicrobiales bacterium]|nr:aminotransferase class I/II-fold pyridoxal phosphate-dependent enzyme [Acidimicrobiales bacterium]